MYIYCIHGWPHHSNNSPQREHVPWHKKAESRAAHYPLWKVDHVPAPAKAAKVCAPCLLTNSASFGAVPPRGPVWASQFGHVQSEHRPSEAWDNHCSHSTRLVNLCEQTCNFYLPEKTQSCPLQDWLLQPAKQIVTSSLESLGCLWLHCSSTKVSRKIVSAVAELRVQPAVSINSCGPQLVS